jgi:hypothetical protein
MMPSTRVTGIRAMDNWGSVRLARVMECICRWGSNVADPRMLAEKHPQERF